MTTNFHSTARSVHWAAVQPPLSAARSVGLFWVSQGSFGMQRERERERERERVCERKRETVCVC